MPIEKEKTEVQWNAADYANHSGAQQAWARELIVKLNLQGIESLLDIGCGDGKVTAEIAAHLQAGHVVGIDSSEEMIGLAQSRFSSRAYPNLLFSKQDARNLPFSQEFDIVFSNAALHWVIEHRSVLAGIYRALKPNGRLLVQMGGKGNASQVVNVVNEIMQQQEWQEFFQDFFFPYGFYSPEEYEPWLREAGFTIVSLELKPKDMVHENKEKFKGWFRTTWLPYLQRIPAGRQQTFIDLVTEKYLMINRPRQQGEICTKMQRLEFTAKK